MRGQMLTVRAYPPPPPPPKSSSKMDSRKILVIVLLLVIIIVSAGVLFYLATNQSSSGGNPTPTPTGTGATPTPTGTGATPTPPPTSSGNNQVGNFKAGTWAQYAIKSYDAGEVTSEGTMKYAIDEGTYSGTACWIMAYEMQYNQESGTMKTVMTYWISKSTLQGIHVKTQIYMNDELISENEEDITSDEPEDMPEQIDLSTATSFETITVPAGTFYCGKNTITTSVSGVTRTTSAWASAEVPVTGLVKMESMADGAVLSTTELISYHS